MLFEGQVRLVFVREGLLSAGISDARVVLVDCDDEVRARRLLTYRNQPESANPTMMNWAAFLRREAREGGYEVLDTTGMPYRNSLNACGDQSPLPTPGMHHSMQSGSIARAASTAPMSSVSQPN